MKASDKQCIYDLLNKAECLYTGKVLSDFPVISFSDDIESSEETKTNSDLELSKIIQNIRNCHKCGLCSTRTNTVPGIGVEKPLVLVIGEGPGADEDRIGEPFVGKAGQLLDKMLGSIQLSRHINCYIANIVKCRPPNNRDPKPEEADACESFLNAQIEILKPHIILAAGRIASKRLLNTESGISRIHGQFFDYKGIPLMPTYHPSALLRDQGLKRPAWEDLKKFRAKLLEIDSEYQKKYQEGLSK